jgi:hypothetical protein
MSNPAQGARETVREALPNDSKLTGTFVIIAQGEEIQIKARGLTIFQIIKIFSLFISRKF